MKKTVVSLCVLFLMVIAGCAPIKNISINQNDFLKIKEDKVKIIPIIQNPMPPQSAITTPGNAAMLVLFGPAGSVVSAISGRSAGRQIIRENNIPDPGEYAYASFEKQLHTNGLNITMLPVENYVNKAQISDISKAHPNSYLLDINSTGWGMVYYSRNWRRYKINFDIIGKLTNTNDNSVVWQKVCQYKGEPDHNKAKTYKEFLINKAQLLKEELNKGASYCANELVKDFKVIKSAK